jgi:hypothetical protein
MLAKLWRSLGETLSAPIDLLGWRGDIDHHADRFGREFGSAHLVWRAAGSLDRLFGFQSNLD